MTISSSLRLAYAGDYSLVASVSLSSRAAFVSPMMSSPGADPSLELAFAVEGSWSPVAVSIGQSAEGLHADVLANPNAADPSEVRTQLQRMLCLDVDGEGLNSVAARDPIVEKLVAERPGVRPVLFPSPYEAAARAIIGQRLQVRQAAVLHDRIAVEQGVGMPVRGSTVHSFPSPARLAALPAISGLSDRKVDRLRGLGAAAAEGFLDRDRLRAMERDAAMKHLQTLAGIGPFSAELVLIRGMGDPDAFPVSELRLHRAMALAYGLGDDPDLATLEEIAESWKPYRSWVGLLLRNRTG